MPGDEKSGLEPESPQWFPSIPLIAPFQQHALEAFPGVPPISPDFRAIALPFALPYLFRRARTSLVCRRRGMGWKRLRLDHITNRGIAFQPALVHPGQHRTIFSGDAPCWNRMTTESSDTRVPAT